MASVQTWACPSCLVGHKSPAFIVPNLQQLIKSESNGKGESFIAKKFSRKIYELQTSGQ